MNEIQPSNIQYVLWADDDDYVEQAMLSRDEFAKIMETIKLDNDLLVYANVVLDDGRHNVLLENHPNSIQSQIYANRWYSTWFIDDNNDLWCRDDTYADGVNYYLLREFNTKDQSTILAIKTSIALDVPTFDSDIVFDNTIDIGSRIIESLDLNRSLDHEQISDSNFVNGEDLTYMTMLINQELDNVLSDNSFDLDTLSEKLIDSLNSWYEWDKNNNMYKSSTIDSMKSFINEYDKMILAHLNEASYDDFLSKDKGKEV